MKRPPNAVKRMRLSLGLSQEQFARALHFSFATVNRWENGAPPNGYSAAILELLNKSMGSRRRKHIVPVLLGAIDRVDVLCALVAMSEGRTVNQTKESRVRSR